MKSTTTGGGKQVLSSTRACLTGNRRWRADSRRARRPTRALAREERARHEAAQVLSKGRCCC